MFDNMDDIKKRYNLMKSIDMINDTYGSMKVRFAINGYNQKKWTFKKKNLSPCYTTRINELMHVHT